MSINSTATVTIGCKLPHGLWLELITLPDADIAKQTRVPAPTGPRVKLNGANTLRIQDPVSPVNPANGRFATTVIEKSFWDKWYERNKELEFMKIGAVFVVADEKTAKAIAEERKDLKTGFEPIVPSEVNQDARIGAIGVQADASRLASQQSHLAALGLGAQT